MPTNLFAAYAEGLMTNPGAQATLTTDTIAVVLYPDANNPTQVQMENEATTTIGDLNTATGGSIQDNSHDAALASITVGSVAAFVFDAADTTISGAAATTSPEAKSLLLFERAGSQPVNSDEILAYFELTSPVTPNDGDIIVQWNTSGIYRFGGF